MSPADAPGVAEPLLKCRQVDVCYDKVQVLFGVDLDVAAGEIVALLGTNGAGKSTLLRAVAGLVRPTAGRIWFDGRDITASGAVRTARLGIVQVPGGRAVFPTLTVAEHFKAGAWLYASQQAAEVAARTEDVLGRFPRLRERWDQMAGNLSGGEQQQLALGMAFVASPRLLIIDELSLGLAPAIVEQLLGMVRTIHAAGCTVILVEQSVNVALTVAQRAYYMEKGQVRFSGRTADLLERSDVLRSVFLHGAGADHSRAGAGPANGKTAPANGKTAPTSGKAAPTSGNAAPTSGKGAHHPTPDDPAGGGASAVGADVVPVMTVDGLTKRFGGITAVSDVSFELRPGETLGLIGPNGAGKTTILDLISGLLRPDAGRIRFRGVDITEWGADRRASAGLGRSFQDARIFPSLTVAENIAIGLERHLSERDHLAALLDLPAVQEMEEDVAYTVEDLIGLLNLGDYRDKFVAELSTGSRRIVDLAMAIAHDPVVLVLDEPSSGIAQRETEALGPLLGRIRDETGCALLVIEHDMPLITSISDRILALELGAVLCEGSPDEVLGDARVIEAYLGGDPAAIARSGGAPAGPPVRTRRRRPADVR